MTLCVLCNHRTVKIFLKINLNQYLQMAIRYCLTLRYFIVILANFFKKNNNEYKKI